MMCIADRLHHILKSTRKRWYVTIALMLTCASLVLLTIWKVHKVQVTIAQLKIDNPHVTDWTESWIWVESKEIIGLEDVGGLKDISSLKYIIFKGHSLGLGPTQVSDISTLRGMSFTELDLRNTKVTVISALKGMPLKNLSLDSTKVSDISALKGMPLKKLWLTKVSDISALNGMPL